MPEKEGGACEEGEMRIGDVVLDEREGGEKHARRRMNVGAAGGGWDWKRDGCFLKVSIAQGRRNAPRGPREFQTYTNVGVNRGA